ncbi:hypothetical protein JOC86_000470 [Bacillus pakistanensis]|uniref:Uncharacterized protein n=1 Tax=Rossellomorea pakistanensis TaxID=992288 RepID=A0ABS2N7X9_9BACI|nr:hypothetical protein [Bacillus pakistanensis]
MYEIKEIIDKLKTKIQQLTIQTTTQSAQMKSIQKIDYIFFSFILVIAIVSIILKFI